MPPSKRQRTDVASRPSVVDTNILPKPPQRAKTKAWAIWRRRPATSQWWPRGPGACLDSVSYSCIRAEGSKGRSGARQRGKGLTSLLVVFRDEVGRAGARKHFPRAGPRDLAAAVVTTAREAPTAPDGLRFKMSKVLSWA